MNKKIAGLALLAVSSVASAEGAYWGVGISSVTVEIPQAEFDTTALAVRLGSDLSSNFALEARIGLGLDEGENDMRESATEVLKEKLKVDSTISLLAIGKLPLSEAVEVYGLAGLTRVDLSVTSKFFETIGGIELETDSESFGYTETSRTIGLGINVSATENTQIGLEYTSLFDKDDVETTAISLGLKSSF